ncbi:MAG: hypothetical protein ACXQTI_00705 [Candidatus Nezhaarchaeales archaeon]
MVNVKSWVLTKKQALSLLEELLEKEEWAVIKVFTPRSKLHREKGLEKSRVLIRAQRKG